MEPFDRRVHLSSARKAAQNAPNESIRVGVCVCLRHGAPGVGWQWIGQPSSPATPGGSVYG
eukprot:13366928-Alexandrium_andersonii.AAC.1